MGAKSQRRGKKRLGMTAVSSIATGHEEHDSLKWENKYGPSITGPMFTAWEKVQKQAEASRATGDIRPLIFRAENASARYGLIVFRDDQIENVVHALAVQLGLIEEK
jgi:hypothetical protein